MEELASLYATLANGGASARLSYTQADAPGAPLQLLSPEAAYITLEMLRQTLAAAGRGKVVAQYTWQAVNERLETIYQSAESRHR